MGPSGGGFVFFSAPVLLVLVRDRVHWSMVEMTKNKRKEGRRRGGKERGKNRKEAGGWVDATRRVSPEEEKKSSVFCQELGTLR